MFTYWHSFFTDPTISTLTSGTPSQNVDLSGMSFPRRLGVRLHPNFTSKYHMIGLQAIWHAYADSNFSKDLGEKFYHEDTINREGWARYYFEGIFPKDIVYIKLEIQNPVTKSLVRTFYFQFKKSYHMSLDSRYYVKDPILDERIVKNGVLTEFRKFKSKSGKICYKKARTTFEQIRIKDLFQSFTKEKVQINAITSTNVRYSEKPRVVFLVTPPHLTSYAKLLLILIRQLVNLNFEQSYMTKKSQKPLLRTSFMLDEVGNLQSEGHGISDLQTILSIGLGQDQYFTLILQTLQQLRDVYGESVDKIVQGNAQPLHSKILTPTGWKLMGDIQIGDEVLTPFGTITKVIGVYPKGVRPVYKVSLRDGSSSEACNEHLWQIERSKSCIKYLGGKGKNGKQLYEGAHNGKTHKMVTEIMNTDELKSCIERGRSLNLPVIKPVSHPQVYLPIDPYVLGVILGDCNIQKNGVTKLTCNDPEIVDEIRRRGYTVVDDMVHGKRKNDIGYRINGVNKILRDLNLAGKRSWEKSIPELYLYSSIEQRLDLLRGLMDTDGSINKRHEMEFSSVSEQLAKDVQYLVRSLGGRVSINLKTNIYYTAPNQLTPKKARDAYRVQNIRLFKLNPFLLSRKAKYWKERFDTTGNRIVSVEYMRDEEVQCIRVEDERHLYITDDFMPTHNTSNIIFLKSTDNDMIKTLETLSGVTHRVYRDSKSITQDLSKAVGQTDAKVTYNMNVREVPVVSFNDMTFISKRNSIVFPAGSSPIWNRNETILPMSHALFKNTLSVPGVEYSLQTIPSLTSALDFDVRKNQPDFEKMLNKRMNQAFSAPVAKAEYQRAYEYSDYDIAQIDPDLYSDEIMILINQRVRELAGEDADEEFELEFEGDNDYLQNAEIDQEQLKENSRMAATMNDLKRKRFAGGTLSRYDLKPGGIINHAYDQFIIQAFMRCKGNFFQDLDRFEERDGGSLYDKDRTLLIKKVSEAEAVEAIKDASKKETSTTYVDADDAQLKEISTYQVQDAFYDYLHALESWTFANGQFDHWMQRLLNDVSA